MTLSTPTLYAYTCVQCSLTTVVARHLTPLFDTCLPVSPKIKRSKARSVLERALAASTPTGCGPAPGEAHATVLPSLFVSTACPLELPRKLCKSCRGCLAPPCRSTSSTHARPASPLRASPAKPASRQTRVAAPYGARCTKLACGAAPSVASGNSVWRARRLASIAVVSVADGGGDAECRRIARPNPPADAARAMAARAAGWLTKRSMSVEGASTKSCATRKPPKWCEGARDRSACRAWPISWYNVVSCAGLSSTGCAPELAALRTSCARALAPARRA
eukprot:scaffold3440_cov135-Isochrysis_galbana.AAC.1